MNNRLIYVPFGIVFLLTIFLLANEVEFINLMPHRLRFIIISLIIAGLIAYIATYKVRVYLRELSVYQVFPMFFILAVLFSVTYLSLANRKLDTRECVKKSVEVSSYQGRYASGYGAIHEELEASIYVLKFIDEGKSGRIVSSTPIFSDKTITNRASLWFCKGALGFEYVKVSI